MAGPFGRMCRDLHGGSLNIKGETVINGHADLNVKNSKMTSMQVIQNGIICKDLEIKGNLIANGTVMTGNGNCVCVGQSGGYSLTAKIGEPSQYLQNDPRGEDFSFQGPNGLEKNYHLFTGPLGDYKITAMCSPNVGDYFPSLFQIVVTEMVEDEFISNPVPLSVVDIGYIDTLVYPPGLSLLMASGNVTATRTPAMWYYWFTGGPSSSPSLFEVRVDQKL